MREPRQLNVQQQNSRTLRDLRATAEYWRTQPIPEALRLCANQRGIDLARSIVLSLDIDFPGMPNLFGVLLTHNERFIRFEIEATRSEFEVCQWLDITSTQNLNEHNRGMGIGSGALAVQLLHELNA